jgi:predicted acylesterase/phospholipase RssA
MKTAVVFSAGGLFGAWEVGAWRELEPAVRPDIVVGASIGALNGWMVAGGCPVGELERLWLDLQAMSRPRWHIPRGPLDGVLEFDALEALIRRVCEAYRPRVEFGAIATDTLRLRPRLFRSPEVTWRHLAASVGMIGVFRQYRIDGRVYSDGGLLGALPLWAAVEMGAERIVAVNCLPRLPSRLMTAGVRTVQFLARYRRPRIPASVQVEEVRPDGPLGSTWESLAWTAANTRRWMERGREDARAWLTRDSP